LKDICCGEKVNRFTQRTALTSGNALNLEDTVFVTSKPVPVPMPAKISRDIMEEVGAGAGRSTISVPSISLPKNINYNPKLKKMYISYKK